MARYPVRFVPGGTCFFTVALADRAQALLTERIDALGTAFRACREAHPFATLAIVVLPDHLHCIWSLPEGDADPRPRWAFIKRAFTRKQLREGPTPSRGGARIWQPRYQEHPIRDETDLERHVDYIHYNPVRHGRVRLAADWPHSSFHRFLRCGYVSAAWTPGEEIAALALDE